MLRDKLLLVVGVVGAAACQVDFGEGQLPAQRHDPHSAQIDRAAARQTIWNPGPGDTDALALATRRAAWQTVPGEPTLVSPISPAIARTGDGIDPSSTVRTLVLYDTYGDWGALGELYGIGATNLASHFGGWTAKPIPNYSCGELASYTATIYLGSSYEQPNVKPCFYDDVLATTRPVIWAHYNVWDLETHAEALVAGSFAARFGWHWNWVDGFDETSIGQVRYKGRTLNRYAANPGGISNITITDSSKANVLAVALRSDGSTLPWAVRSGNFTYLTEIPFTYMTEEDRYLIFADLLFDALAPSTAERHRVVLRIEDISPVEDPAALEEIATYLESQNIPFGFGVISQYEDPLGWYNDGAAERVKLRNAPLLVGALKFMQGHGGTMLMHGYTHQFKSLLNPYTAVSGDDTEFFRVYENLDHTLTYAGPLSPDTVRAAKDRFSAARKNFQTAGLTPPAIFEFPHYAASANAYKAAAQTFGTRWERALYFPGVLAGTTPSYGWMFGQLFPYPVRDVYGTRVLPEDLGNIEPEPFYIFPVRFPADIINAAEKNLVVRDGVAGFYFHPFFDIQYLKDTVAGLKALGYEFVSPESL